MQTDEQKTDIYAEMPKLIVAFGNVARVQSM
jgi:hypothetical protein